MGEKCGRENGGILGSEETTNTARRETSAIAILILKLLPFVLSWSKDERTYFDRLSANSHS